jgi:hypothetical protein
MNRGTYTNEITLATFNVLKLCSEAKHAGSIYKIILQMSLRTLSWDVGVASEGNKMATFPISCKLVAYVRLLFPFFQRIFHVASVPMTTPWHQLTFPWNSDASLAVSAPTKRLLLCWGNCGREQETRCYILIFWQNNRDWICVLQNKLPRRMCESRTH